MFIISLEINIQAIGVGPCILNRHQSLFQTVCTCGPRVCRLEFVVCPVFVVCFLFYCYVDCLIALLVCAIVVYPDMHTDCTLSLTLIIARAKLLTLFIEG